MRPSLEHVHSRTSHRHATRRQTRATTPRPAAHSHRATAAAEIAVTPLVRPIHPASRRTVMGVPEVLARGSLAARVMAWQRQPEGVTSVSKRSGFISDITLARPHRDPCTCTAQSRRTSGTEAGQPVSDVRAPRRLAPGDRRQYEVVLERQAAAASTAPSANGGRSVTGTPQARRMRTCARPSRR
jgi:hypothetical protein